jgi:hypothetical protein
VEGDPNPRILNPHPSYTQIRSRQRSHRTRTSAQRAHLETRRRQTWRRRLWCLCRVFEFAGFGFDNDFLDLDFLTSSPRLSGSSAFLFFVFFSLPSFFATVPSLFFFPLSFNPFRPFSFEPLPSSFIAPLNRAQLPILASDLTLSMAQNAMEPCP